jgi:hypothetical protein
MTGQSDELSDYLRDADTVTISTKREGGGRHNTPIWSVTVDGVPYIRSVHGADGIWYQEALRGGASIVTPSGRTPVRLTPTDDRSTNDAIDAAYASKYSAYPQSLNSELTDAARRSTLIVSAG